MIKRKELIVNKTALFEYYRNFKPYSSQDYVKDALEIIDNRINGLGYLGKTEKEIKQFYASRWGNISKKRRVGFVIGIVYYIASKENLDLTMTLGLQLIKKLYGRSINENEGKKAFANKGRNASEKSKDFARLDEIAETYREWALVKQDQYKYRMLCNKDLAFEIYQRQTEQKKQAQKAKKSSASLKTSDKKVS